MTSAEEKFSQHITIRHGKLYGWQADSSAEDRHKALAKSVRKDGYATTIRRLNLIHNLGNPETDQHARQVAVEDEDWVRRKYGDDN